MISACRRTAAFLAVAATNVDALSLHQRNDVAAKIDTEIESEEVSSQMGFRVEDAGAFIDVTPVALPQEWYSWNHSGMPRSHQGTPTFVDLNKDGLLDYFYHNHYEEQPQTDWDLGLAEQGVKTGKGPFYKSIGADQFKLSEPDGSKWTTPEAAMDTHGSAILDIDRDGTLDLYIATGGGDGLVGGPCKNAVVMWGVPQASPKLPPKFVGGRDAAEYASLHNKDSRGRFNYWADINQDGLLDVIFINEPRADPVHSPGFAMINKGKRKFEYHTELSEYTESIVLTDADGDGKAEEYVVPRRDCAQKTCMFAGDNMCKSLSKANPKWYEFCKTHPEGSLAIYKFDHGTNKLKNIYEPTEPTTTLGQDGNHVLSMQTGDWDGDGKADLAMLTPTSIDFYYSSDREAGQLPTKISQQLTWKDTECEGAALRAADMDNDGQQELMVLCGTSSKHRFYSRWADSKTWQLEKGWLGAFTDNSLVHPTKKSLENLCTADDGEWADGFKGYLKKMCDEFHGQDVAGGHLNEPRSMGLSVVDFNNDGYLDVSLSYDTGRLLMLKNTFKKKNKFIAVKLVGRGSNEYGVGATVVMKASGMKKNSQQFREVYSVSHETDWLGTRDDRLIFGLGPSGFPESIEVRWPGKNGKTQIIKGEGMFKSHINNMENVMVILEAQHSE